MVTLPVVWPVRLLYNVVWSLASMVGILPGDRSIAAPSSSQAPIEDVRSFRRSFADSYGGDQLHFHDGTYSQVGEDFFVHYFEKEKLQLGHKYAKISVTTVQCET